MIPKPTISVLMATYNGRRFLDEQLDSIARQDWPHIDVWASDDGSADGTLAVLENWRRRWHKGRFCILAGPRQGYVENFRALIMNDAIEKSYVAFSDQDDIWDPQKLSSAIRKLDEEAAGAPAMYCGRTRLVDSDGTSIGLSPLFSRPPTFRNALVQSIGGGNTIVLNSRAFKLVQESSRRTSFVSHDWWCYLLVSGAGGKVIYDPVPKIGYRQHGGNIIGKNTGIRARFRRLKGVLSGSFSEWNDTNVLALERCRDLLDGEAYQVLEAFIAARTASPVKSVFMLWRQGIYRQTWLSNGALHIAAALRKL